MKNSQYVFSACRCAAPRNPAAICAREIAENNACSPYARLYVKYQPYEDLSNPAHALKNGTFFNALYMPYQPPEPAACGAKCGGETK